MATDQSSHAYGIFLGPHDPAAEQPEQIRVTMKPHQRAALQKALVLERDGKVCYNLPDPYNMNDPAARRRGVYYSGKVKVESNVGILGDIVGYGKTLTALSIVAANPVAKIHRKTHDVHSFHGRNYSYFTAVTEREEEVDNDCFIHTTLIVAPRGPVFVQWEKAIKNDTDLNLLVVDNLPGIRRHLPPRGATMAQLKEFFEQYDIVLVKATTLKTLLEYYEHEHDAHPIRAWDRIMIDEAHDIAPRMPIFSFRFMWLISATYRAMLMRGYSGRSVMTYAIKDILEDERMNLILLRGTRAFVTESFSVPPMIEHYYLCATPSSMTAVQGFLSRSVQERINAGDVVGAIRELGGHNESEADIVGLVTRELERDIRNKERERDFISALDIAQESRQARINTINAELQRLHDRQNSLTERVTALSSKQCPICFDNYKNPILLPCKHVFCGGCLMNWIRVRTSHRECACPECRSPIQCRGLIAIVKDPHEHEHTEGGGQSSKPPIESKEDTIVRILSNKPDGRFLIFSRCDYTFLRVMNRLRSEGITHAEMKGSTATMVNVLERFRSGQVRVIMLNTHHAGSGIDISCATDVILYHQLNEDGVQAIGRAQRVGRTQELHVHHLCFAQELANQGHE